MDFFAFSCFLYGFEVDIARFFIFLQHKTPLVMKYLLLFLFGGLFSLSVVCHAKDQSKDFDIYLMIGQSNMAGRGVLAPSDTADVIPGVWILNSAGKPEPARVPFNIYSNIRKGPEMQQVGPAYSFARQMHAVTGRKVLIVQNARGGSGLKSWQPGGDGKNSYLDSAIVRCRQAQMFGELKGICWHQGETDITNGSYGDVYVARFRDMISCLRSRLGVGEEVPVVVGEVGQWNWNKNALFEPDDTLVAQSAVKVEGNPTAYFNDTTLAQLCREVPNCHKVCSDGLRRLGKETDPHFSREGQLELGNRYGRKMRTLIAPAWIAPYRDNKRAAVSFTYDDGLLEHYEKVAPELERRGFRGSFWIIGNVIGTDITQNGRRMTWQQVGELHRRGHEIGGHTWSHPHLTQMQDADSLREEIVTKLDQVFLDHGLPRPLTMAWPYNGYNDQCREIFETGRIGSRIRQVGHGENNSKSTPEKLEAWLARTIQQEDWGVTMTHAIEDGYDKWYHPDWLWEFYDKVKAREQEVWVGTFGEVLAYQREADATQVRVVEKKRYVAVSLSCPLDPQVFSQKLTLCVKGDWRGEISVTQNGYPLSFRVDDGLLLIEADPYGKKIIIRK